MRDFSSEIPLINLQDLISYNLSTEAAALIFLMVRLRNKFSKKNAEQVLLRLLRTVSRPFIPTIIMNGNFQTSFYFKSFEAFIAPPYRRIIFMLFSAHRKIRAEGEEKCD